MVRPLVFALNVTIPVLIWACAAFASGGGHDAPKAGAGPLGGSGIPFVDMPALLAPVTKDGDLKFYAYIVIKLELTSEGKKSLILEKMPYLQDAFLREAHAAPIEPLGEGEAIDNAALVVRLTAAAKRILGEGVLSLIEFRSVVRAQT